MNEKGTRAKHLYRPVIHLSGDRFKTNKGPIKLPFQSTRCVELLQRKFK